jgi:AraC family transcriptional regulator of adaptative response/methylated-DNA-[protein]-cysteine methyltransferase
METMGRAVQESQPAGAQRRLVESACRALLESDGEALTLKELGRRVGASPFHLQRTFKRIVGVSPRQLLDAKRIERFKARVRAGSALTEALYDAGYGSSSRLYERAPSRLGMTPRTYSRGGQGMDIAYVTAASPLGRLLVARTERGLCAVSLAESDAELKRRLRREFPEAEIRPDRNGLAGAVRSLLRFLRGELTRFDLPLDVRGTAFQCRVWEELLKIPYGRTRSYGEIARAVGKPGAARAVGTACGSNPLPLIIPCHRVVRGGGQLGGYGLGLPRKRALLKMEKRRARV